MTNETLTNLAAQIAELPGVQAAKVWNRVAGREAIYVELTKHNGGQSWNGGVGRILVVSASGAVEWKRLSDWAGAATRDRHAELGTVAAVEALVSAALAS